MKGCGDEGGVVMKGVVMKGCGDEGGVVRGMWGGRCGDEGDVVREVWRGTLVQKMLSLQCLLVGPFIPCQNS